MTGCRSFRRVLYSAHIDGRVATARIDSDLADNAVCQLFSRIHFRLGEGRKTRTRPTPLKIKRTLDAVMAENGIGYLTGTMVRRVLRDSKGVANGVEVMNRSGMSVMRARKVIDATRYGALGAIDGGGAFEVGATEEFSRVVIVAGDPPSAPGMDVERLPGGFPVYGAGVTGIAYRCTMRLPMADDVEPRPAGKGEACADVCDIAFFTGRPLSERGMEAMRKTFAAMRKIRPDIVIRLDEKCKSRVIILLGADALLKRQPTARPVRGAWIAIDGIPSIMTYSPDFIFGHFQENSPRMNKAKLDMWNDVKSAVARL